MATHSRICLMSSDVLINDVGHDPDERPGAENFGLNLAMEGEVYKIG